MSFAKLGLCDPILTAVAELGYNTPTSIQKQAIPVILSGRDLVAAAQTGTGKTASFVLPMLTLLNTEGKLRAKRIRGLILTPTRELAIQIGADSEKLAKLTKIKTGVITGGVNYGSHADILTSTTDILVATPGRLLEYIENEQFDAREIEILVLDEADRMLDMGFSETINRIVGEARWRKQTMLFSATLEGAGVLRFAKEVLKEPEFLESNPSRKEKAKIHQWLHLADNSPHKLNLLVNTLKQEGVERTVVFANKRETVQYLSGKLYSDELPCVWLEGKMPQDKRNKAIERFKSGEIKVLVATDVAARGLDIVDITHVINFDMPRKVDVYIHRIGRTGRAGAKGTAISLVEAHDMAVVGKIERYQNERLQRRIIEELRPKNKEARVANKKAKIKLTTAQKKAKTKKQTKKKIKKAKKSKS